jgi:hypothetical protein
MIAKADKAKAAPISIPLGLGFGEREISVISYVLLIWPEVG